MNNSNQRGDTLIEVIFALIIMTSLLLSALSLARVARINNQNSQLRSQAVNLVQEQYEALKSFRNNPNVPWNDFYNCNTRPADQLCKYYYGIDTAVIAQGGAACTTTPSAACTIHFERDARKLVNGLNNPMYGQWTACPGPWHPPVDRDETWSGVNQDTGATIVLSPLESGSYYSSYSGARGCRGDFRTTTAGITATSGGVDAGREYQPNILLSIQPTTPLACGVATHPQSISFQITATWKQGGLNGSTSTSLNTIVADIKGPAASEC